MGRKTWAEQRHTVAWPAGSRGWCNNFFDDEKKYLTILIVCFQADANVSFLFLPVEISENVVILLLF